MKQKRQRGGTILGFIIGVVVGLGSALAVAVYVTKVPVPFMTSKAATRSVNSDVAESQKNKDWDPNTPLHGKNPAKPSTSAAPVVTGVLGNPEPAGGAITGAANGISPPPAPAAAPAIATVPAKTMAPAASADPLGDLARAKTKTPTAAATVAVAPPSLAAAADPFEYFVQAGAFRTPEDAEAQRAKLAMMGLEARVTEREQSGRTVYRVRMGPFNKKEDAENTKDRLDNIGTETALVRVQR